MKTSKQTLFEKLLGPKLLERITLLHEVMQKDARKTVKAFFDEKKVAEQLVATMVSKEFQRIAFSDDTLASGIAEALSDNSGQPENVGDDLWYNEIDQSVDYILGELKDNIDGAFTDIRAMHSGVETPKFPELYGEEEKRKMQSTGESM